jgi:hypothetical protein
MDVFKEGVRCTDANLENFGEGDGRDFQKLSKDCPFFALEFAAIGLRNIRKHWGPSTAAPPRSRPTRTHVQGIQKRVDQDKLAPSFSQFALDSIATLSSASFSQLPSTPPAMAEPGRWP